MFGYVTTDGQTLDKAQKERYQALYCGLCRRLGADYGSVGRAVLTYDMTFLAMLLGSVYDMQEETGAWRCPANPLRQCAYAVTEATGYAADMNVLLAYYKSLDDWTDDHSVAALGKQRLLAKKAAIATERWPTQSRAVQAGLLALSDMEKRNELNPDLPANCFGYMLGELFVMREDERGQQLRAMGEALGRFIYMMDACMDLPSDIRRGRYNPLVAQLEADYTPMLTMLIGESTAIFEALPLHRDVQIMRNILYSGVWVQYQSKKKGRAKEHE